jgi:hypothetical protein
MINYDITSVSGGDPEGARLRLRMMSVLFEAAPRAIVQAAAEIYKAKLKEFAPKSGKPHLDGSVTLAESHIYRTTGAATMYGARFMAKKIAMFVILGTKPHDIWAGASSGAGWGQGHGGNWRKALFWPGAPNPFVHVHHPGTRANDYRNKAAEAAIPEVAELLRSAGISVAKNNPGIYAAAAAKWAGLSAVEGAAVSGS